MDQTHLILTLLVTGFVLLGVGFNWREHEWGIRVIGLGTVVMLIPIAVHVYSLSH